MNHPEAIFIQPTTACNARCEICPHKDTYAKRPREDMPDSVWQKILADIINMKFTGQVGLYLHCEPLMCDSIFQKMRDIRDKTEAFVVLSTNGTQLHERNRAKLIEARPRRVYFHPPLTDPSFYKGIRDKVFENVKALIDEAEGLFEIIINLPRHQDEVRHLAMCIMLRNNFPYTIIEDQYWAVSRAGSVPHINAKGQPTQFSGKHCQQPERNFCILHDGSVIVCCNDWKGKSKQAFFNVVQASIVDIYNGYMMSAIREEFEHGDYGRFGDMCKVCAKEIGFEGREK